MSKNANNLKLVSHRESAANDRSAAASRGFVAKSSASPELSDLQCIYGISQLSKDGGIGPDEFVRKAVLLIAETMGNRGGIVVHATIHGRQFMSGEASKPAHRLSAEIAASGVTIGTIELISRCEDNQSEDPRFTDRERILLENLADQIGHHLMLVETRQTLRNFERRFFDITNFLPDPTFAINLKGEVIAWNRAMEQLTEIKAEDILGKGDYEYALPYYGHRRPLLIDLVLSPTGAVEPLYPHVVREGNTLTTELFIPLIKPHGRFFWVKASLLYDSAGNVVGAIETTRDITDRRNSVDALTSMYEKLKIDQMALREKNVALKEVLGQIEENKAQLSHQIKSNLDRVVMPIVRTLRDRIDQSDRDYLKMLESNLTEITSPFINKLEYHSSRLSPRELEICNMIRNGLSSKEIAIALKVSVHTVLKQRQRIRTKLGIVNENINLNSHLKAL